MLNLFKDNGERKEKMFCLFLVLHFPLQEFLSVSEVFLRVQTMIWLAVLGIFNVRTGVRESALEVDWAKNPLPHWGLEPASVLRLTFQSDVVPAELSRPHSWWWIVTNAELYKTWLKSCTPNYTFFSSFNNQLGEVLAIPNYFLRSHHLHVGIEVGGGGGARM